MISQASGDMNINDKLTDD